MVVQGVPPQESLRRTETKVLPGRVAGRASMAEERKVFMVRHAQSEANVASARLGAGEVSAIWPFLTMGSDAPISDMGRQQLAAAQAQLVGFIEERGVQLIAHSPLVRAQQTAHALFGDCGAPLVELPFVRRSPQPGGRAAGTRHAAPQLPCAPASPLDPPASSPRPRRFTSGPRASGRASLVPSSRLTRRPPSPAAAPHCPPCHSHGPGRPI